MTIERKILIILGVLVLALAVFGFTETTDRQGDYYINNREQGPGFNQNPGRGFGQPSQAPAYEYKVTHFSISAWGKNQDGRQIEDHLNNMGYQGWSLIQVVPGNFSGEYTFFFARPVAQWR